MRRSVQFDWLWAVVIVALVAGSGVSRLPWPIVSSVLAICGGLVLWRGWGVWRGRGGPPSRGKVTYWRGQRIELEPPRRSGPALPSLAGLRYAALYLVGSGLMLLVAIGIVLRANGL